MAENSITFEELKASLGDAANKSVTGDMITRLETKLPKGAFGAPPPPPYPLNLPNNPVDRTSQLEDSIKALKERFDEIMASKETPSNTDSMMVGSQESMKAAFDSLCGIVDTFNDSLREWYRMSGCVVNFSWKYEPDKLLEISGVDVIVFRKTAPSALSIKEALEKAPTEI
jgi:hypothetical protein